MRRPGVPSSCNESSDWKGAFVARFVRLCPEVGAEAAAEVSEAALMTNQGIPPWIAAAEWAALWVRRVRSEAGATAPAPQQPASPPEIDPEPPRVEEPPPPPITVPAPYSPEPIRTARQKAGMS
jgi:hypothetical protein